MFSIISNNIEKTNPFIKFSNNKKSNNNMNALIIKNKLLLVKHRHENKTDYEIVKEKLYDLCELVIRNHNKDKKISWNSQLIQAIAYTHNSEYYDRKMVTIDRRLFTIPKEIRVLGDFEFAYGHYFLINNENKNDKNKPNSFFRMNISL
jgi:hypothetical protein